MYIFISCQNLRLDHFTLSVSVYPKRFAHSSGRVAKSTLILCGLLGFHNEALHVVSFLAPCSHVVVFSIPV